MSLDLDEMERLAKAATPGPWGHFGDLTAPGPTGYIGSTEHTEWIARFNDYLLPRDANASYVAACSPDRILALVAELRASRELLKESYAGLLPLAERLNPFAQALRERILEHLAVGEGRVWAAKEKP